MAAWEAAMSLETYWTYVVPLLLLGSGAVIVGIGWLFIRDRHPKAGE
jgi:hypothetical protein